MSALLTSNTESNPKPSSAIEPAMTPLAIAITASRLFHPIVSAVSAHAQRRKFRSMAGASTERFTGAAQQEHPSAQVLQWPAAGFGQGWEQIKHEYNTREGRSFGSSIRRQPYRRPRTYSG
jgi:hypothetical protein